MNQKMTSTSKFLATTKICDLVSKNIASEYAKAKNEEPIAMDPGQQIDPNKFRKEIGDLCNKFSIKAYYEPTKSATRDKNGEYIPFVAITQKFEIEAPVLTEFVAQLAGLFEILPGKEEVIIHGTPKNAAPECQASYFVGGREIYAVSLTTGKILRFTGQQGGGASLGGNGEILVGLNIEREVPLETIIHELLHEKWPEEVPQEQTNHEMIDAIANEIKERLDLDLKTPISEIAPLRRERLQIIREFEKFDKALERIVFPKENSG